MSSVHRFSFFVACAVGCAACAASSAGPLTSPPDPAVALIAVDSGPSAIVGQHIIVSVRATDSHGHPAQGAVVAWATVTNAGSLDATSSTTDATGTANIGWTVGTVTGPSTVSAAVAGVAPIQITELLAAGAPTTMARFTSQIQTVTSGTVSAPMTVRVIDQYGNGVPNVIVTWTTSGGTPSPNGVTDATGHASMTLSDITPNTEYDVLAHANVTPGIVTFYLSGTP